MIASRVFTLCKCRSEVNIGLPASEGRNKFTRVPSAESFHSCHSGGFSMLEDVSYVIDEQLGAKVGVLGWSLGAKLDR